MKLNVKFVTGFAVCSAALSLAATSQAQTTTGFLYVSDYGLKNLDRYSFTYNTTTGAILTPFAADGANNSTTSAVLISGNIKEGLQGTATDLIVVEGNGSSIGRYKLDGTKIADITVTGFPTGHTALQGVGNVAITSDGKYMYAPDESAGYVYKINLATGHIDSYVAFSSPHDVAIGSDGTVYVAGYNGTDGIQTFDANLGSAHTLVANANISHPSGISLTQDSSGNTTGFYVNSQAANGQKQGTDAVDFYSLSGSGATETATYNAAKSGSSSSLKFSFGNAIGPDGNVYTAELGNYFGNNASYTGGIYEFNTTTQATSLAVAGMTTDSGGNMTNVYPAGLDAPKYLQFNTNFIKAPDAGYTATPEPGAVALFAGMGLSGAGFLLRRKRK